MILAAVFEVFAQSPRAVGPVILPVETPELEVIFTQIIRHDPAHDFDDFVLSVEVRLADFDLELLLSAGLARLDGFLGAFDELVEGDDRCAKVGG